jgi:outer membrane lipoprotein-sorting protein
LKRHFIILIALTCCASHVGAQARRDTLTGNQVLERSRSAYAGLSSYAGETVVLSEMAFGDTVMTGAATAEVRFMRPGRLRISGRGNNGSPYLVVSDGTRTRVALVYTDPKERAGMLAMGGLLGLQPAGGDTLANDTVSAKMGIAMIMGIGNRAPYYLPALLGLTEGTPLAHVTPAVLVGRETVSGVESYRVVIRGAEITRTFWVDTVTYLLRQMQDEQTGAQVAGEFGRIAEKMAEQDTSSNPLVAVAAALAPTVLRAIPRAKGSTFLVRFSNLRVNTPLDPALFALSARKPEVHAPQQDLLGLFTVIVQSEDQAFRAIPVQKRSPTASTELLVSVASFAEAIEKGVGLVVPEQAAKAALEGKARFMTLKEATRCRPTPENRRIETCEIVNRGRLLAFDSISRTPAGYDAVVTLYSTEPSTAPAARPPYVGFSRYRMSYVREGGAWKRTAKTLIAQS